MLPGMDINGNEEVTEIEWVLIYRVICNIEGRLLNYTIYFFAIFENLCD